MMCQERGSPPGTKLTVCRRQMRSAFRSGVLPPETWHYYAEDVALRWHGVPGAGCSPWTHYAYCGEVMCQRRDVPSGAGSFPLVCGDLRGVMVSLYRPTGHQSFPKGGKAPPPSGVSPAPPSGAAAHMVCPIRARSALENPLRTCPHCTTKPVCVPTDHNHA